MKYYDQLVERMTSYYCSLAGCTPDRASDVMIRLRVLASQLDAYCQEAEEAAREAYLAEQEGKGAENIKKDEGTTNTFINNMDKSWYFYNSMTKNQGKNEFQRRWGARKLEDDWRRRNKTTFSLTEEEGLEDETEGESGLPGDSTLTPEQKAEAEKKLEAENDPHKPEYYLKQIPKTPEEIQTANDVIQEGLYNMGIILKDKLEDFAAARREFIQLLDRYPDNTYRLDVYYNLYLMAVRQNNKTEAEKWRRMIIDNFPDSPYGQAMLDPQYFDNLRKMNDVQEKIYSRAYEAYLGDDNAAVHRLTAEMERDYPLSKILPKFVFIDALSYLTEENTEKFQERLTHLLEKWPDTDMTPMAGSILKGLKAGRKPHAGLSNSRGMIWSMRLSNDSVATGSDGQPANFERDPNSPQYLVLAFPRDSVSANQLLYEVARFNFSSFTVRDFDLEPMSFGNVGLLVIKGFDNLRQLEHYRSVMAEKGLVLPEGVRPIMISKPNFELLLREGRSFEEYFRFEEGDAVATKEEEVLNADTGPDEPGEELLSDETAEEAVEKSAEEEETPAEVPAGGEAPAAELKEEEETSEE